MEGAVGGEPEEHGHRAGRARLALALAALGVLVALASGCGGGGGEPKIALLLPDGKGPRYRSADRPAFERRVRELCPGCTILYSAAGEDFSKQRRQAFAALDAGADVLVLDPVPGNWDIEVVERARAEGVPVVSYDALAAFARSSAFVSYDDVAVGRLQAEVLARKLAAEGRTSGPIVMLEGEPGNRDQHLFEEGARRELAARGVKIASLFDTPYWGPQRARAEMNRAIRAVGRNGFAAVYAETDGIGRGAIEAMEAAGIDPATRPVTGRDATLKGVRQILTGRQYMTTYEPIEPKARIGAEIAVLLAEGGKVPKRRITERFDTGRFKVPSILLEPVAVTRANVKRTVIADGFIAPSKLCAGRYEAACRAAGISG